MLKRSSLFSLSILMLIAISFSGCWNKDYNEPGRIEVEPKPTEAMINGGFQRVWAATQTTMAKFPLLKKDADSSSGRAYIVTDWVRGKSDLLYHGFDVNRVPYIIRYKLYIYVASAGGKTKVTIKNMEEYLDDAITSGVDMQGSLQSWIKTESSTLKENSLLQQIEKLTMDPTFKPENVN